MKTLVFLNIVLLLLAPAIAAETVVPGGPVSGTWTQSGSPYLIEGEIVIPTGQTLAIEPGVIVVFNGHHELLVQGRLLAVGTVSDSIRFGAADPEIGWHGIRFKSTPAANDSSLIRYCHLEHGRAEGEYPDSYGGAVFVDGFDKIRIANSLFIHNTAAHGGGLYCRQGGLIIDNQFISNNAAGAYGYEGSGSAVWVDGATQVIGNRMEANWAWDLGSTASLRGNALLRDNIIRNNSGMGVICNWQCDSRIENNVISGNSSNGISCISAGAVEIVNCLIQGNADSGLKMSLSFATVLNCTITGNTAVQGGGIFCSGSDPIFINSILWGNTAGNGDQLYLHLNTSTTVGPDFFFCNVEGGIQAFAFNTGVTYNGRFEDNIDVEPFFSGGGDHPYALSEQSYCINAGRPDCAGLNLPEVDLAALPRIHDGFRVDIGAYEYPGVPAFADMPVCTPDPGWYPLPQQVSLDSPTPEVSIRYTFDGSEPTQASPLYLEPLHIDTHTMIRAKAFHATLPPSLITTAVYRIGSDLAGAITGLLPIAYSPYSIVGDLEVPIGETLTLEPGVELVFADAYALYVQGRLLAQGTPAAPIRFTAAVPLIGWRGIRFEETPSVNDSSKIEFCFIEYGKVSGDDPNGYGGGISVRNYSKVRITDCRIRNCSAFSGGGIGCYRFASPHIANNVFKDNTAYRRGGGLYTGGECGPRIAGNTFTGNTAAQGGGYCGFASGDASGPLRLVQNIFSENHAIHSGGYIPAGGAMYIFDGGAEIYDNLVIGNTSARYGAGIHVEECVVKIHGNIVSGNVCELTGGGVVCYVYARGQLVNNLIIENQSTYGGGLFISHGDDWKVTNNTICLNSAEHGGGFLMDGHDATLRNCILWANEAPDGAQIAIFSQPLLDIEYCDVQGGKAAIGGDPVQPYFSYANNIDADPLFVGAGEIPFALSAGSPCIDAGTPDTTGLKLPPFDLAGNPRVTNERVDMGAYEFPDPAAIGEEPEPGARSCFAFHLAPNQPNPFRAATRIHYTIPASAHVQLKIYDAAGRRVRTLIDRPQTAGEHTCLWDGRDTRGLPCAGGIYFARLSAERQETTRRTVLLR